MSLQEKFQITVPAKEEVAGHEWQDWTTASVRVANMDKHGLVDVDRKEKLNKIPGLNIADDVTVNMPLVLSGENDVSNHVTAALGNGFVKLAMKGTDDQYTGEHTDLFYGDAGGFVERNNYMDRE